MKIWNSREHKCQVCGKWLGREPLSLYFEHLIEKKPHPELRHVEENLLLVCSDCHHKKTNGFPMPKHKEAIEKAKEKLL